MAHVQTLGAKGATIQDLDPWIGIRAAKLWSLPWVSALTYACSTVLVVSQNKGTPL